MEVTFRSAIAWSDEGSRRTNFIQHHDVEHVSRAWRSGPTRVSLAARLLFKSEEIPISNIPHIIPLLLRHLSFCLIVFESICSEVMHRITDECGDNATDDDTEDIEAIL